MNFRDTHLHSAYRTASAQTDQASEPRPSRTSLLAGLDIGFVLASLRRHVRMIALVVLAGLLATYGALKLISPRYTATASLMLDLRQKHLLDNEVTGARGADDQNLIESQIELLRSGRIAARALASLTPEDRAPYVKTVSEGVSGAVTSASALPTASAPVDAAAGAADASAESLERLLRNLKVERKGRSYIVDLRFTDTDRVRSATIANAFVDAFVADQLDGKRGAIRAANAWLEQRIGEIGTELEAKELHQQSFRGDQDLVEVGDMSLLEREIGDTALQLAGARSSVATAIARLEQIRSLTANPDRLLSLDSSIQSPVITDYRRQIGEVERKKAQVTSQFGTSHPNALAADAELRQLQDSMRSELVRIVEGAELELQTSQNKARLLQADLQALKERSIKNGQSNVALVGLQREIDATSNLYVTLLRRFKETQALEKEQSADAHVVTYATPATRPSFPNTGLFMLLAGLCWFGIGAGAGVTREILLPTLRTPGDVERIARVECVAAVPLVDVVEDGGESNPVRSLAGPIHWQLDDRSARKFNTAIFNIRKWTVTHSTGSNVLIVAGVHPAHGASTIALQLAQHAARTGLKTALVDADLRSAAISEALWKGGGETYADAVSREDVAQISMAREGGRGVKLFPSHRQLDGSSLDILGSQGMGRFIEMLRDQFDLIVIDAPPLATYADAEALADHADAVLLVAKAGTIDSGDLAAAVDRLSSHARLGIATALNMVTS